MNMNKMKKYFYLFAAICTMAMFTACSSDDDDKQPAPGEVLPEIVGTWNLAPAEYEDDGWGGQVVVGGPVVIDWQCTEGTILNIPMGEGYNLPLEINTTLAPLTENLANTYMPTLLQSVTFEANGDITAVYGEDSNDEGDDDEEDDNDEVGYTEENATHVWKTATGYAHWKPTSSSDVIYVYLDSEKILASEEDAESKGALSEILDMFKDGIPVHIRWNADKTSPFFYVDLEYIKPMILGLSGFASKLPTDDMDEEDLQTVAMLQGILGQMPEIMDNTQKFEAGLRLVK